MRAYILAVFFTLYIRIVGWTSSIRYYGEKELPDTPHIYAFWHCYILLLSYSHRGRAVRVVASISKDGDISARANKQFGHRIIRGTASSTKEGAKTAIKIIKCLKNGNSVALTPDGPKGPRFELKKGVCYISMKSQTPIIPIAWASSRFKTLGTWDRTLLPLPFSKIVLVNGKPIYVNPEDDLNSMSVKVAEELNNALQLANDLIRIQ